MCYTLIADRSGALMKNLIQDSRIGITSYKRKIVVSLYLRCGCGKYKGERYRGIICEKCALEVRRESRIDIPREILVYYGISTLSPV